MKTLHPLGGSAGTCFTFNMWETKVYLFQQFLIFQCMTPGSPLLYTQVSSESEIWIYKFYN